jgi:hypothetical protein
MLLLPSVAPPTVEELLAYSEEEQQLLQLEQQLEAKVSCTHHWLVLVKAVAFHTCLIELKGCIAVS